MKKYKFSQIERFSIWKAYNYLCFYCRKNLKWKDLTIDHLFPESLSYNDKGFIIIKKIYALKGDFCINDFVNWVPAHEICNNKKGDYMPHYSTNFTIVYKLSSVARSMHDKLLKQRSNDEVLAKILSHLEKGSITTSELYKLIEKTTIIYFGFPEIELEDVIHVPDNWKIIGINRDQGYLVVTDDGQRFGKIPLAFSPDATWLCPSCKRYGPWDGDQCLICGLNV
jgi:hypothetical protein